MADKEQKGDKDSEDSRTDDNSSSTTPGDPDDSKGQDSPADIQGNIIGDFRIIRKIGDGAMGVVFEAEQISLRRRVALKVLPFGERHSITSVKRFQREAEAGGRQRHPGIVTVYAVGEDKGVHYIAMELVDDGLTLRHKIAELKKVEFPPYPYYLEAAEITAEVAEALHHAHEQGVIHRDIKPGNILLTREGRPVISDFGLAKFDDSDTLTEKGMTPGTPGYMSPEQAQGMPLDHRTDIFSLGATFYELLTFDRPFKGPGLYDFLNAVINENPLNPCSVNPIIPPELAEISLRALEKKPSNRFQHAGNFADVLRSFVENTAKKDAALSETMTEPSKGEDFLGDSDETDTHLDDTKRSFLSFPDGDVATATSNGSGVDSEIATPYHSEDGEKYSPEFASFQGGEKFRIPQKLGDFEILREIGRSGFSIVYEARQLSLDRSVALEVLPPFPGSESNRKARFRRYIKAVGRLNHPGIIMVHGTGEQAGFLFIAYELIESMYSLMDAVRQNRESEITKSYYRETAQIMGAVCDAMEYAHQMGVIHRDIKPANILLTSQGSPKVTGFDLALIEDYASLSRTGDIVGTPYTMSPEQAMGQRGAIDHRTDIYSLGMTLYEALTLKRPFEGSTSYEVLRKIILENPIHPRKIDRRIPRKLAAIPLKAMQKNPADRYQSMAEFGYDLRRYLQSPLSSWIRRDG